MIKVILWDLDGTLLNFEKSEKFALKTCFTKFGLGDCGDELIQRYSVINRKYWERLEQGLISKTEVLEGRFCEFFTLEGINCTDYQAFNNEYQVQLGETISFCDNARELIQELKQHVRQYIVTNGTLTAQEKKLKKSGLHTLVDGVFISDVIGYEKPDLRFFEEVFRNIGDCQKEEMLIVGDSLTSDMEGGRRAGIKCVWYNPNGMENTSDISLFAEIRQLQKIKELL